jgi:hypothetical protein
MHGNHEGTTSQKDTVESAHLMYIDQLNWQAVSILSNNTTFEEIAAKMNLLLTMDDSWLIIQLNKWSLL